MLQNARLSGSYTENRFPLFLDPLPASTDRCDAARKL